MEQYSPLDEDDNDKGGYSCGIGGGAGSPRSSHEYFENIASFGVQTSLTHSRSWAAYYLNFFHSPLFPFQLHILGIIKGFENGNMGGKRRPCTRIRDKEGWQYSDRGNTYENR